MQRLIAGSGSAASKQQRIPTTAERQITCKKLCNALQTIWRSSASLTNNDSTVNQIATILKRLNNVLEDESRKAAPHSCLIYAASHQIYIIVAKLALSSNSHEVINAAAQFFHFLINGEVEGVLDSKIFARSLVDLVRRCTTPVTKTIDDTEESALIELLFEICTKIRLDPDILPAWFYPERGSSQRSSTALDARRSQFPLFHLLLEYVHYDGPIGDFARTALLYLTETASRSGPLEKWMMESDLAPQMASGLSAFYGRLSRTAPSINKASVPVLSHSDVSESVKTPDESYEDDDLNMRAFLSYLAFWQDTLTRCKSVEVRDTLLDSFQVLFVEQLLYPSLLESSDVEGGSTAAVMLHLCRLLDAVENPQLTSRMLIYLFASKVQPASKSDRSSQRMSLSRRKSLQQLANFAQLNDNPSPELFSLLDLIVFSLRSDHFQTVASSLKLVSILIRRHHPCVKQQLFQLEMPTTNARHNLNELNSVMMTLFDCAGTISQTGSLDSSYQAALADTQIRMEQHSCLLDETIQKLSEKHALAISQESKIFQQMLNLLGSWFTNDALVNLELTSVFAELATCEGILMRTWLAPLNSDVDAMAVECPSVISILEKLMQQVATWRSQFIEWDAFYSVQKVELCNDDNTPSLTESSTTRTVSSGSLSTTLLETKLPLHARSSSGSEVIIEDSNPPQPGEVEGKSRLLEQSLGHVLTQSVILQEFILELAAALQIRATLFNEVDLS